MANLSATASVKATGQGNYFTKKAYLLSKYMAPA
jgi:hypothetical protein